MAGSRLVGTFVHRASNAPLRAPGLIDKQQPWVGWCCLVRGAIPCRRLWPGGAVGARRPGPPQNAGARLNVPDT